jgi:hypothetical protein
MIDVEKMNLQEQKDFDVTKKIMTKIFAAYGCTPQMTKMDEYSPYDAKMAAKKRKYHVEIKERNVPCIEDLETLPLKVKKYCNILENTPENVTPIIIYLVNDEKYYIFNLRHLDLNKVELRNWVIPKVNYTQKKEYDKVPTFFIPIQMAQYNGLIN